MSPVKFRSDRGVPRVREKAPTADTSWIKSAACLGADPKIFFPVRGEPNIDAKSVCSSCLVRDECLDYALAVNEKHGVWGGLSERERAHERRRRRVAALYSERVAL